MGISNIRINGGYVSSHGGGHGAGFGDGCNGNSHDNRGYSIVLTGGTLLPYGEGTPGYEAYDIGGHLTNVVFSGGSIGNGKDPHEFLQGDAVFKDASGNLLKMIVVNMSNFVGEVDYPITDWSLTVDGMPYAYGAPCCLDRGQLYLWLPEHVVDSSEIGVSFKYYDEGDLDESGKPVLKTPPTFVTSPSLRELGAAAGKDDDQARFFFDFPLPEGYTGKFQQKLHYNGTCLLDLALDDYLTIEVPGDPDRPLTEGGDVIRYRLQRYSSDRTSPAGPELVLTSSSEPTPAGNLKLSVISTQYASEPGFQDMYWGHKAQGWIYVEPADSQTSLEASVDGKAARSAVVEEGDTVTLKARVQPAAHEAKTCEAPTGSIRFLLNGGEIGTVELGAAQKDAEGWSFAETTFAGWDPVEGAAYLDGSGNQVFTCEYVPSPEGANFSGSAGGPVTLEIDALVPQAADMPYGEPLDFPVLASGRDVPADEVELTWYRELPDGGWEELPGAPSDAGSYKVAASGDGHLSGEAAFSIVPREVTVKVSTDVPAGTAGTPWAGFFSHGLAEGSSLAPGHDLAGVLGEALYAAKDGPFALNPGNPVKGVYLASASFANVGADGLTKDGNYRITVQPAAVAIAADPDAPPADARKLVVTVPDLFAGEKPQVDDRLETGEKAAGNILHSYFEPDGEGGWKPVAGPDGSPTGPDGLPALPWRPGAYQVVSSGTDANGVPYLPGADTFTVMNDARIDTECADVEVGTAPSPRDAVGGVSTEADHVYHRLTDDGTWERLAPGADLAALPAGTYKVVSTKPDADGISYAPGEAPFRVLPAGGDPEGATSPVPVYVSAVDCRRGEVPAIAERAGGLPVRADRSFAKYAGGVWAELGPLSDEELAALEPGSYRVTSTLPEGADGTVYLPGSAVFRVMDGVDDGLSTVARDVHAPADLRIEDRGPDGKPAEGVEHRFYEPDGEGGWKPLVDGDGNPTVPTEPGSYLVESTDPEGRMGSDTFSILPAPVVEGAVDVDGAEVVPTNRVDGDYSPDCTYEYFRVEPDGSRTPLGDAAPSEPGSYEMVVHYPLDGYDYTSGPVPFEIAALPEGPDGPGGGGDEGDDPDEGDGPGGGSGSGSGTGGSDAAAPGGTGGGSGSGSGGSMSYLGQGGGHGGGAQAGYLAGTSDALACAAQLPASVAGASVAAMLAALSWGLHRWRRRSC